MNRLASNIANALALIAVIWLPVRASMPRSCCCSKVVQVADAAAPGSNCCSQAPTCCGGGHRAQHGQLSSSPRPKPCNCPCNCPCKCSQRAGAIAIASIAASPISRPACFVGSLPTISPVASEAGQDFVAWHANSRSGSGFDRCVDLCRFRL